MQFENRQTNLKNPFDIRGFFGVSTGCFIGTGYGFIIGFGRQFSSNKGLCIVYPSRNPFAHSGHISGCYCCYCGIAVGVGFGSGITCNFGVEKKIENSIFKILKNFNKKEIS
mmetsp:Transcript_8962/g.17395  ORF Transcript_8962/g.17395 Transcript_8962/m.17395 type:complete len:112 (-) Transcript_8962:488-823(-)